MTKRNCIKLLSTVTCLNLLLSAGEIHADPADCGMSAVAIHSVQGSDASSPLAQSVVTLEGIVVGDFQDGVAGSHGDLNGFFLQQSDAEADADSLTSEGIFIFDGSSPAVDVAPGDRVRVSGTVSEFGGLTQLSDLNSVDICLPPSPASSPAATDIILPLASIADLEAYEGMLVSFPQSLTIVEYFNFDRFGEIALATDRLFQPTALHLPNTAESAALAELNERSRILLDDGRSNQNPDPARHPDGQEFNLDNRFRGGDLLTSATGILDFRFGQYRLQPVTGAQYSASTARPLSPEPVGGSLSVASLNVLNYFSTIDLGSSAAICGPLNDVRCRGADDSGEQQRQLDKLVSAIVGLNADILGLIEVENTAGVEALTDIVAAVNLRLGAGSYAYVDAGLLGPDVIKVALLYRPATVSLQGSHAVLDTDDFLDPNQTGEPRNRAALAQSFIDVQTGGVFSVVVNHFKSKGRSCGLGDDSVEAGNCNITRKLAAAMLIDWLATDPTASGDADMLIIGDLNAYDKEDPVAEVIAGPDNIAGTADDYVDLVAKYAGEYAYSYLFGGEFGYLDYALANTRMNAQVTGATIWHINADEPDILDYDTSFKKAAQAALYEDNAFRSSDHDPVLVGLDVCDEIMPEIKLSLSHDILWPPRHKYVTVTADVSASDNFDSSPDLQLLSVVSNEADNGEEDGDTVNDILVVDDLTFMLRAERSSVGSGREYAISYIAEDDCGNTATETAMVRVPLSRQ